MSYLLIAELEAKIKRRDERIVELEELIVNTLAAREYFYTSPTGEEL